MDIENIKTQTVKHRYIIEVFNKDTGEAITLPAIEAESEREALSKATSNLQFAKDMEESLSKAILLRKVEMME